MEPNNKLARKKIKVCKKKLSLKNDGLIDDKKKDEDERKIKK